MKKSNRAKQSTLLINISKHLPRLFMMVGGLFVLVGVLGIVFVQQFLLPSQDPRSQAVNPAGEVLVRFASTSAPTISGQPIIFTGFINTSGIQTDGIQLVMTLPKQSISNPTLALIPGVDLQIGLNQVVDLGSSYELRFIALPISLGLPFSTDQEIAFLKIQATANQTGNYQLSFDQNRSLITVFGSNPVRDELSPIQDLSYAIASNVNAPTATPTWNPPAECNLTVPLAVPNSVSWINQNQIKLNWHDVVNAVGFRLYLITDGTPTVGQPYVIWNVLENNGEVAENVNFAPVETDENYTSIRPTANSEGNLDYIWTLPADSISDRLGEVVKNRSYYRFLVYAYKSTNCHKQAAIGRVTQFTNTSPTATPTPIIRPNINTLSLTFGLQGLSKGRQQLEGVVTLQSHEPYLDENSSEVLLTSYNLPTKLMSQNQGLISPIEPLELTNVPISPNGSRYDIFVKTPVSLRKKLGTIIIKPGVNTAPQDWSKLRLLTGDFWQNPVAEWNVLNLRDITQIISAYTHLQTPVNSSNQKYDVNFDQIIDIMDVAIVLSNYTQLEIRGD